MVFLLFRQDLQIL